MSDTKYTEEGDGMSEQTWHAADRGIGWEVHKGKAPSAGCWTTKVPDCQSINDRFRETMTEEDAKRVVCDHNAHDALVAALEEADTRLVGLERAVATADLGAYISEQRKRRAALDAAR